jgi:hypothetical protein
MTRAQEGSEDGHFEVLRPEDFLPADRMPLADKRLGIDRWTGDAGLITFAASLDPAKRAHRVTAWVLLSALLLPFLLIAWRVLGA